MGSSVTMSCVTILWSMFNCKNLNFILEVWIGVAAGPRCFTVLLILLNDPIFLLVSVILSYPLSLWTLLMPDAFWSNLRALHFARPYYIPVSNSLYCNLSGGAPSRRNYDSPVHVSHTHRRCVPVFPTSTAPHHVNSSITG